MTERARYVDPTEAMSRPHVLGKYGPGPNDRLPARIRPTLLQASVVLVGVPLLLCVWWFVFRGVLFPGQVWIAGALVVPVVVGRLVRTAPVDGRSLPRTARSVVAHRVRSGGRATGRWMVHGHPVPATSRRPPKPVTPATIPAGEGEL